MYHQDMIFHIVTYKTFQYLLTVLSTFDSNGMYAYGVLLSVSSTFQFWAYSSEFFKKKIVVVKVSVHPASRASFIFFFSFLGTKHMYRKKRLCLQGGVGRSR